MAAGGHPLLDCSFLFIPPPLRFIFTVELASNETQREGRSLLGEKNVNRDLSVFVISVFSKPRCNQKKITSRESFVSCLVNTISNYLHCSFLFSVDRLCKRTGHCYIFHGNEVSYNSASLSNFFRIVQIS